MPSMSCCPAKGFPVLVSGTSGLHVCSCGVWEYTAWESRGVFYFRSRFLCLKQLIKKKKNEFILKTYMSLEPTVSRASDPSAMGTKLSSIIFVNDDFAIVKLSSSELDVTLEVPPPPPPPPPSQTALYICLQQ